MPSPFISTFHHLAPCRQLRTHERAGMPRRIARALSCEALRPMRITPWTISGR